MQIVDDNKDNNVANGRRRRYHRSSAAADRGRRTDHGAIYKVVIFSVDAHKHRTKKHVLLCLGHSRQSFFGYSLIRLVGYE
jgi:hypothetical protein